MHLIIDGYGSSSEILQSEEFIYQLLEQYPAEIGMTRISSPYVLTYAGSKPEEAGISGFVFIAESHISIHTFPDRHFLTADVYTCQEELDVNAALHMFKQTFTLKTIEHQTILRGREYNKQVTFQH